jgi:hypothetical protein
VRSAPQSQCADSFVILSPKICEFQFLYWLGPSNVQIFAPASKENMKIQAQLGIVLFKILMGFFSDLLQNAFSSGGTSESLGIPIGFLSIQSLEMGIKPC